MNQCQHIVWLKKELEIQTVGEKKNTSLSCTFKEYVRARQVLIFSIFGCIG